MDRLKKYMFLLLLLVFLLGLAVSFPSFFLSTIIQPITLVFWAILRILNSVDQSIYWMLLIVVCSILVLRLIPTDTGGGTKGAYQYTYRADSRIAYWQNLISNDSLGDEDVNDLRDSLQKLFVAALPPIERSDLIDWERIVASGRAPLSLPAQRFLFPPKETRRTLSQDPRLKVIYLAPRWMRKWVGKSVPGHTAVIAEILAWIETEMEIYHDQ
ncbi:MAG TPA: hypothetical protein VK897_17980 [Anaerolineales bacterium]|nr:hypothetical protein [Anaerolineales bacterium]